MWHKTNFFRLIHSGRESNTTLILILWPSHRQQRTPLMYLAALGVSFPVQKKMLTFLLYCPWKRVVKWWRKLQVSLECGNLWNARSVRGGDSDSLLPQDKLTFTFTRYIQTTPYLITLICILSRGVSFNVYRDSAVLMLCIVQEYPTF